MSKTTFYKILLLLFFCSTGYQSFAQNLEPFTIDPDRGFDEDVKGDILTIGNTILNRGPNPNDPLNADIGNNSNQDMQFVDIDGDPTTFNSSSAELLIPDSECFEIRHAVLYWGAVQAEEDIDDLALQQIKFRGPTGGYIDITGDIIYRREDSDTSLNGAFPYAAAAEVTDIVRSFTTPESNGGFYTVANIQTRTGVGNDASPRNPNGYTAGWSLFVVYEDPTLPAQSITSFEGFSAIFRGQPSVDIPIDGFRTIPNGLVNAKLGFATLEGDLSIGGDRMSLNGTDLSSADRPAGNFFRSLVTQFDAQPVNNRIPNSSNTLGFDTGVLRVPNPMNQVINNGDTSAVMELTSTGDFFLQYFFAFAVEIIEPDVVITKTVEDASGTDIGDQVVNLGQELNYVISLQNVGNDNATEFTIRDVLPINTEFDFPSGLDLPSGVTAVSYDPLTRELILNVEDFLLEQNDPAVDIRIQVNVVENCSDLVEACSNLIQNQAFATYSGSINEDFIITDDPSVSSNTGCLLVPQATNILANLDPCEFREDAILCADEITLTAAAGFDTYSWSTDPSGTPVIGTDQSLTVTETGTYYVLNTAPAPCRSIEQIFDVITFGENQTNPIIPQADEFLICPIDGLELPNIFLCGLNDERDLTANISGATSIIWEVLDTSLIPADCEADINCPNRDACAEPGWTEVATETDYTVTMEGQYRLNVDYGSGCTDQFFFNVSQNVFDPSATSTDILCDTPGSITVLNVPAGYEYSLDGVDYQPSNVFPNITVPDFYTVFIRLAGIPVVSCEFTVPDVEVRERDFTFDAEVVQPLCNGDRGSIMVVANDAQPQYTFSIFEGGVLVNTVGPIVDNNFTFENLGPGTYTATVDTDDGCIDSQEVTIIEPPVLSITADLVSPFIDCQIQATDADGNLLFDDEGNPIFEETQGQIMMNATGGTPPYVYFINSTTVFQSSDVFDITAAGVYNITVVDANSCDASTTIEVEEILPPEFMVTVSNIDCSDDGNVGVITFDVTATNGSTLEYSIDNGMSYSDSPIFTNLVPGIYQTLIRYTFGPSTCMTLGEEVTITIPDAITGTIDATAYTCTSEAEITVSGVSGGTPDYIYSINGIDFQTSTVFPGLTDGTYTVVIQDANGCTFTTEPIVIAPLDPPTDLDFAATPVTCPDMISDVTLSVTGGTTPLEYRIIAPTTSVTAYQTSPIFMGLAPRTYTFEVRDINECTYSESFTIDTLPVITVVAQTQSDVTCFGDTDGEIEVTVTGSTNFEYTVNGGTPMTGTSPITLTGLAAGSYTIEIRDIDTNCSASDAATVNEPVTPLSISADESIITCVDSGSVILTATGGWGGYTYSLTQPDNSVVGPQSSNLFTDLTIIGTYTATVEDINGCQETTTFTLATPEMVVATIDATSDLCFDGTDAATIEVTVTAGTPPFQYNINGGPFQTNNVFENLAPGSYTIIVRDANGCTTPLAATTIAIELTAGAVLNNGLDCLGSTDADITVTINGGTAPFSYGVSFNGGAFISQGMTTSPFDYITGIAGTYQFQITDAEGCMAETNVVTINPLSPPAIDSVVPTAVVCNGDSNGSIAIVIDTTVGTPAFEINVFNDSLGTDFGTQTSGLPAGDYTITLTDANGCTDQAMTTIMQPEPIVADITTEGITCDTMGGGTSLGSIDINSITGGTPLYDIFVTSSNGFSDQMLDQTGTTPVEFDIINFGIYQVSIVDDNECVLLVQDILIASPPDDLDILVTPTIDCALGGEAEVAVATTLASSGPFFFAIFPVATAPPAAPWIPETTPGSGSALFTGLISGVTYTFIVHDTATGCDYFETSTVPVPTDSMLAVSAPDVDNITCTGSADGDVSFTITSTYGVDVDVTYEIRDSLDPTTPTGISGGDTVPANGSITIADLGPLGLGNYIVIITETTGPNAGCGVVTNNFNITESPILLDLAVSIDEIANCNPNSGVISAIGSNGTSPYLYQITTTPATPLATDPAWATPSVFNVDAGTYYVHVLDAFGCIVTSPAQIVDMDPSVEIDTVLSNPCTLVEGTFEIDVTLAVAGASPYSVSIDGGSFQTQTLPFTITGLNSGTHTVEIQDSNGCGELETITILAPLSSSSDIITQPSCDNDDGEFTVTTIGGSGTYTYSIAPTFPSITLSGNTFSGVPAGTYVITTTDIGTPNNCSVTAEVTLEAATPVTFTPTPTDVSCNGASDGTITITLDPGNNNPEYTYEITAPIVVAAQNSPIFEDLAAGTYTVQVNSGRGCFETENVIINEPTLLTVSGAATPFACAADNSVNTSTLTITGVDGTPPYTYSIDDMNYFTTNTFDIIDTGVVQTINIFIIDDNGCPATNTVIINPLEVITAASVDITSPIDCNETGEVTINVTGGSGNFEYILLPSGTPQVSNVFAITEPGAYFFQVNDLDTGCFFLTDINIAPFDTIEAEIMTEQIIECFGDNNGEISLTVTGYTGTYNYQLLDDMGTPVGALEMADTASDPQVITGLAPGSYSVSVSATATPFCTTDSNTTNISTPIDQVSVDANETANVTCDDGQGIIAAIGSGGTPPYEFELSGAATVAFSTTSTFENLSAGTYTVTIRDANNCTATDDVILELPDMITATFTPSTTLLNCFGDQTASITVTNVMGGQDVDYNYTLNRILPTPSTFGPQPSNVFPNLGAGTYSVTILDPLGCELTSPNIVIDQPEQITSDLVLVTDSTCQTDATVTLSASGGTPPYTYSDMDDFSNIIGMFTTDVTFTVPADDTVAYEYFIRDANGCGISVSNQLTIDEIPDLTLEFDPSNTTISCLGETTGSIIAVAQGGLGNYMYTLENTDTGAIVQNTTGMFDNLPAGNYIVSVESEDCGTVSLPITIFEPVNPFLADIERVNVACFGENNGMIIITPSGGSGMYQAAISNIPDDATEFSDLSPDPIIYQELEPGIYFVIAQDENGCFVTDQITITEPDFLTFDFDDDDIIPETCAGDMDASITITISGGTPPYFVGIDLDDDFDPVTGIADLIPLGPLETMFTFTGLSGGEHIISVYDANVDAAGQTREQCDFIFPVIIPNAINIIAEAEALPSCDNNVPSFDIVVTIDDDSFIPDPSLLVYSLDSDNGDDRPAQTSNVFTNVQVGSYFATVSYDSDGDGVGDSCPVITNIVTIDEIPDPLTPPTLSEGEINQIVANTSGGFGDYIYTISPEATASQTSDTTFAITATGTYTVIVTDSQGCQAVDSLFIEFFDVCIPDYFTPNGDGVADVFRPGCIANFPNIETKIFDRYGRVVAILRGTEAGWDGRYDNNELPTGDYWYVVNLGNPDDNREFVGHFTLYR